MLYFLIKQEVIIAFGKLNNLINSTAFFVIAVSIFAINFNNDNVQLNIGIIWLCLTFAILLGSNNCFQEDFYDGTFEQLFLSGYSFELIIVGKILSNWLINSLPLIIILPFVALILRIDGSYITDLVVIAAVATMLINFIVSFGASLVLSANNTGSLLTILVLPFLIPIIIFANSALSNDFYWSLKFLLALLVLLAPILTFATGAAIKLSITE